MIDSLYIDSSTISRNVLNDIFHNKKKLNSDDILKDLEISDHNEILEINRECVESQKNPSKRSTKRTSNNKKIKKIKINNRKKFVKTYNKLKNLEERDQESIRKEKEINENRIHNTNRYLSSKCIKIRNTSMERQTELNFKTPFEKCKVVLKNSVEIPSKNDIKLIEASMKLSKQNLKKLNFNEFSRPLTRQMIINNVPVNPDTPLKNNDITKNSACKFSKNNSEEKNIITRKRSAKFGLSYNNDSEMEEEKNDNIHDKDYEGSEKETTSYEEYFNSLKHEKFSKISLVQKSTTNNKKKSKVSKKSTKQLSQISLKNPLSLINQRITSIDKPSTSLQNVRLKLHVSVLPKSLPCREEQFNNIYTYLHTRLSDGSGGCIYISGVPGTGKTATVNEVIHCLNKSMNEGKLTKFDFININGMKLSEPRQVYVQIWKQLTGDTVTWEAAHKLLHSRFTKSNSKRNMILLLVDELDLLCTNRQHVVYNLLEWPSRSDAKLVVVTIANTMDLPERILMSRITSRLGLTRLTFPPYNHKQLEQIVLCRLKDYNAFSGETIQLIARKVAAVSGDARRALDICRRATEVAEINGREMVSMIDVKIALDEMIASPKIQAIKYCSDLEKMFLKAVSAEVHRTGLEEVVFKNVYFQLHTLCTFDGKKVPNITEALSICARLGSWRLLLCDHSQMDIHQRLLLNATTDDVHFAIGY